MVKALECYLKEDHEALNKEWQGRLEFISSELVKIPGVTTTLFDTGRGKSRPSHGDSLGQANRSSLRVKWSRHSAGQASDCPCIGRESAKRLSMNSFMLKPGEDKIIAEKLSAYLRSHAT